MPCDRIPTHLLKDNICAGVRGAQDVTALSGGQLRQLGGASCGGSGLREHAGLICFTSEAGSNADVHTAMFQSRTPPLGS